MAKTKKARPIRARRTTEPLDRNAFVRRAGLLIGGLALSYAAFASALAGAARGSNSDLTLRVAPNDPVALIAAADRAIMRPDGPDLTGAARYARRSLAESALNAGAVRVLGFVSDAHGQKTRAARLMTLSAQLSRRDAATQLWLIERAVRADDLTGALAHYDIALRTSRDSGTLLFPLLGQALGEPAIRSEFAKYIAADPLWLETFLYQTLETTQTPEWLSESILKAGGLPKGERYRPIEGLLLQRLAGHGQFAVLERYFRSLPNAKVSNLSSVMLDETTIDPRFQPISWQLAESSTIGSSFVGDAAGGERGISIFAASGATGLAATKLLFLAPGRFALVSRQRVVQPSAGATAFWELKCLGAVPRTIWRSVNLVTTPQIQAAILVEACPAYALELQIAGGADQEGLALDMTGIAFRRLSGRDGGADR